MSLSDATIESRGRVLATLRFAPLALALTPIALSSLEFESSSELMIWSRKFIS